MSCERLHVVVGALLVCALLSFAGASETRASEEPLPDRSPPDRTDRPPPRHGPPPIQHLLERHADRLALSPQVAEQIEAIANASHARLETLHREHREAHDGMRSLLSVSEPDEAAVMQQAEVIGAIDVLMHQERLSAMIHIRALLTPEQLVELTAIHQEERARRGPGRGGPPPGMPPPPGFGPPPGRDSGQRSP